MKQFLLQYEWVEEHLGLDFINLMILTRDKTMINGHLLIDDRPDIKGNYICVQCMDIRYKIF